MRRRILVAIVTATTLAVVLFGVPLGFTLANLYEEQEVVRLERAAAEATEGVPAAFPDTTDPIELAIEGGRTGALYGRDGRLVTGIGPARADAVVRAALRGDVRDAKAPGVLIVATPITRGEQVVGALRISTPSSVVTDRTASAVLTMIAIGAAAIGLSGIVAWWQSRRLATPVGRLARDATRLGDGDFTLTTQRSGVPEIDAVAVALDHTASRLEQLLARERTFSEDASHQLRTPVAGLRVTLEAAMLEPDPEIESVLTAAIGEVTRLERTIDDLLALRREPPMTQQPLDVGRVLTEIDDDWRGRLAESGRPLRVTFDTGLPNAAISGRALRQILDVLIDNAWKHGSGVISIEGRTAGSGVAVRVSDEGSGIDRDEEAIFARRSESSTGHGIGLALARSLAGAEGARLVLERSAPHPMFAVVLRTARATPGTD